MTNLSSRDTLFQTSFPTVMVPLDTPLVPLQVTGHRFLSAANGLWMEVKQAWLHAIVPLAVQERVPMPYGRMMQHANIVSIPQSLIASFRDHAKAQLPNECAAHIIMDRETGAMRLQILKEVSAGMGHVKVTIDPLTSSEVLVLDLHSHGYYKPFFSATDDRDDQHGVKLAAVISFNAQYGGQHNGPQNTAIFRLCLNGVFLDLTPRFADGFYHFSL